MNKSLAFDRNPGAFWVIAIALVVAMLPIGAAALTPTTTTLVSSPNPSTFGQAVTLTGTVSPASATGRVTFYDGVTVLGTRMLLGGRATLITTLLPSGRRSLKAYYAGDASFEAGASATVAQTVVAAPQNGFRFTGTYNEGGLPVFVTVGDFNGDGKADLAVANSRAGVSVLLGNGDGTFQVAVHYSVGGVPFSVAVGDFNGDGKADLAVANRDSGNVSVLRGNGDGTFQAAVNYNVQSGPLSVAVGDFNGDGKADLAVTGGGGGSVLLGSGDGTFRATVHYNARFGFTPRSVAVGDFNGDGKADLATNGSVLLGNGDGTFPPAVNYNAGSFPSFVAVGDFNGDGQADLAVANTASGLSGGGGVSVLRGNGDGAFQPAVNYGTGIGPFSVAVGDFNGDGKADLAVTNANSNNASVLLGNGDGTFQAAVNYNTGPGPFSVAVGDFNGDGKADLAVARFGDSAGSDDVIILLGVVLPGPVINAGGVVTGANYAAHLVPGVIATVFGSNLSSGTVAAASVPLPTALGGVSVTVNGIVAPLFYVSPTQINFQIPWELLGQNQTGVVATVNGLASAQETVSLRAVSPGIFSLNSSGSGQGAIQISNTMIFASDPLFTTIPPGIVPARPAQRGELLTIYCSGLGDVSLRPATGAASSGSPLSNTLLAPSVTIGGVSAPAVFAGLSPGFVGLYQVNVQVPAAAPAGRQIPVVMTIGGVSSNTVTIAVQ